MLLASHSDALADVLTTVAHYQLTADVEDDPDLHRFVPAAADARKTRQRVFNHPSGRGPALRLVGLEGLRLATSRRHALPWDTGGFFDLYFEVRDLNAVLEQLEDRGWQGFSDVVEYEHAGARYREIILRGPDGIAFCLVEPLVHPGGESEVEAGFGPVLNLQIPVRQENFTGHSEILERRLGWQLVHEGRTVTRPGACSPSGLPHPLAAVAARRYAIFARAPGERLGSLQIQCYEGVIGRDVSERKGDGIRGEGIVAVRLFLPDRPNAADRIEAPSDDRPVAAVSSPSSIPPFSGRWTCETVILPDGARIDCCARQ